MKFPNKYQGNLLVLFLTLIFIFFFGEIATRTYHYFHLNIPFFESIPTNCRSEQCWEGKQILGDPKSRNVKIFFIGDSFTVGAGVSEKYMYYNIVKTKLNVEIFVYGGGAYGTLQEYLVLNKLFDYIKPDLVVLQVCDNDFINNSWDLESSSFYFNNFLVRPYLIDGKIEYRFPIKSKLLNFLANSRFFLTLLNRTYKICAKLELKGLMRSAEIEIWEKGINFKPFKDSVDTTNNIIKMLKKRLGKTPLIAFDVDNNEPNFSEFKKIFKENNIRFIETVPQKIKQAEMQGINVKLENHHFNETGNLISGQALADALQK